MKTYRLACGRLAAIAALLLLPAAAAMSAPSEGGFETGLAIGLSGAVTSFDFGFAGAGGFDFSVGLAAGLPWSAPAPAAELRLGASVAAWRSRVRIEASALGGVAKIPGTALAAPYGGCALGFDLPLGRSAFSIRAETLAKFGGREYPVSATNPAGTARYVESWRPALVDLQLGIRWAPKP